jgi:hypothetical protein
LRIDNVESNDDRWFSLFTSPRTEKFIDNIFYPVWIGESFSQPSMVSRDGITFKKESQLMLFGSYFFLSDETLLHTRKAYDLLSVLSDFGGILEIFMFIFFAVWNKYNEQGLLIKSIRAVYFETEVDQDSHPHNGHDLKPIKLRILDSFSRLLKRLCCCVKKQEDSHTEALYTKAKYRIRQDLNMFRIIQAIHKIKATLSVLIGPDVGSETFKQIKETYY